MNKRNKIISTLTAFVLAIPVIGSTVTALTTSITNKLNEDSIITRNSYKYLWQGKYYNSYQDIVNHILNTSNDVVIGLEQYYGDVKNAIFDQETKKIDITKLRPFDWQNPHNRISPAWINALGQYVRSYDEAKNSFINLGLVRNFYADTCGKLYLTYEEAEAVNKKGVRFDEIAYYEVNDSANNKTVQINPLNKEDIAVFQKIAFDNINNVNIDNFFAFDLLQETNQAKSSNLKTFTSLNESNEIFSLTSKQLNDILSDIISDSIKEWILNLRVDVHLSLLNYNDTLSPNYSFTSSNSDWVQSVKSSTNAGNWWNNINDRRDGVFKQIRIKDLGIFESFLDRDTMLSRDLQRDKIFIKMEEQRIWWWNQKRSKYIDVTLSKDLWAGLDNAPTQDIIVNIHCEGDDLAGKPEFDVDILSPGTRNGAELYFGVQIQDNEYFKKQEINNDCETKFNTELFFSTNNVEKESVFQKITKEYIDKSDTLRQYSDNIKNDLKNIIDLINNDTTTVEVENNGVIEKQSIRDEAFNNKVVLNNEFLETFYTIYVKESMKSIHHSNTNEYEGFNNISKTFFNSNYNNSFNNSFNFEFTNNTNNNFIYLNNYLSNYILNTKLNNYSQVIKYKNMPIFSIDLISKNPNVLNTYNNNLTVLEQLKDFYRTNFNSPKVIKVNNISNYNWNVNIDQATYFYDLNKSITNVETDSSTNRKLFSIDQTTQYKPIGWGVSTNNTKIKIKDGIYGALNAYNNNILSLNNIEYSTYSKYANDHTTNNNVASADDVLVLKEYDQDNDLVKYEEAIYGKYLRGYSFSETLFNPSFESKTINDNKLVLDSVTEDELRKKMMSALPSKITIIFDISGKIRNPGVNSDGIIDTSNPAIYDSEQNVINNLMWTTVVEKDPHKSFYLEDDGTYTLIDNTVNAIYPLYWNGKTNYFASYEDAEAYLLELIKLEAVKVLI
ncbi:hypothetical protein ACJA29_01225 [Metamycoplasma sualvi]|uniref:hypothetical protein n=1 Tax=Metamycoplasma sualvi TaxID=2125 RepID=UPI003873825C